MVALHNQARLEATPTPDPPLPALIWSDDLAASAQAWANNCRLEHSDVGENLYASTDPRDACAAMENWVTREAPHYRYSSRTCAAGEICGHYTQVVWRDTREIGCAFADCPSLPPVFDRGGRYWVCHYNPPGNFIGEPPY